jgi:alkylhydroperoxidase family enzyme
MAATDRDGIGPAGRAERLERRAAALRDAVFGGDGVTESAMRRAVAGEAVADAEMSETVSAFGAMVRDDSYRVTDAVIQRLRAAGCSEDAVFELTIAAALGAADRGLAAGLKAVARSQEG